MADGNTSREGEVLVGGHTRPDGSRAPVAHWIMNEEEKQKFEEELRQADARTRQERAKKFAIPEDIQEGTASHVWYDLQNAIMLNEEKVQQQPRDEKTQERIRGMKIEQGLINQIQEGFVREIPETFTNHGKQPPTHEQTLSLVRAKPAVDTLETLEGYIEPWERENAQKPDTQIYIGGLTKTRYPAVDVLKAAGSLQARLSQEATRTPPPQAEGK